MLAVSLCKEEECTGRGEEALAGARGLVEGQLELGLTLSREEDITTSITLQVYKRVQATST